MQPFPASNMGDLTTRNVTVDPDQNSNHKRLVVVRTHVVPDTVTLGRRVPGK
jgi:hypothetical protein